MDAGVFIAAAHGSRTVMALMKSAAGTSIFFVAAHTLTEFHRGGSGTAREALLLKQWRPEILTIDAAEARLAGELLGRTGGNNSMDAIVVAAAALHGIDEIFTTDPDDIERLRNALGSGRARIAVVDASDAS